MTIEVILYRPNTLYIGILIVFGVFRRLLHAMHQAKMEEAMQQAKALQKAMQTGQMATIVSTKLNNELLF